MKKIILLVFISLTILGCKKIAKGSLNVRTNNEYIVVDKTKRSVDFHYSYLIDQVGDDMVYNYQDTANFSVGDTLVLTIKRK